MLMMKVSFFVNDNVTPTHNKPKIKNKNQSAIFIPQTKESGYFIIINLALFTKIQ